MILEVGRLRTLLSAPEVITRDMEEYFKKFIFSEGKYRGKIEITSERGSGIKNSVGEWPLIINTRENDIYLKSMGFHGYFDNNFNGKIFFDPSNNISVLENFFRVYYSIFLLKNGGMLLHSAGVEVDGKGFVFVGQSGSGKTTISRVLMSHGFVYSDDIVAIRREGEIFNLYSTPFRGEETLFHREFRSVPLRKIFLLNKSREKTILNKVHGGTAVAKLFANLPFVNSIPGFYDCALNNISELLKEVEVYDFYFKMGDFPWEIIK